MTRAILCIDDAVGEHRRLLLDEARRPFRLEIERWSERGRRVKLDEIWWGRIGKTLPGRSDVFVDLGLPQAGVLETEAKLHEGALVPVRVKSEAWADKGPLLKQENLPASVGPPQGPQRHSAPADGFVAGIEVVETIEGEEARRLVDYAAEEATASSVAIPGGGRLAIDPATALTAIDVDSAGRPGATGAAFDLSLNLAAASEAARQIALRGLGGLVVVDFVSLKEKADRAAVAERFREDLARLLGRATKVLEISALGLCEASVARRARPVASALASSAEEREALTALRLIESEGRASPRRIEATLSQAAAAWLEADAIGWQAALAGRIGARWVIRSENRPAGPPKVRAEA